MFQELCADLMDLHSETSLPPLEIQQSKVVTNVAMERDTPPPKEKPLQKVVKKDTKPVDHNASTKLTKKSVEGERRVKQK